MPQTMPGGGFHTPSAVRLLRVPSPRAGPVRPAPMKGPALAPATTPRPAAMPAVAKAPPPSHVASQPAKVASRPAVLAVPRAARRAHMMDWVRVHKAACAVFVVGMLVSAAVVATVLIQQNIATTPSAAAPDVTFLAGTDYTSILATGFGVLSLGTSGASAALTTLKGIPGASTVDITNLLRIQGAPTGTKDYSGTTLSTDVALNSAITHLYVTVKHGSTTDLNAWDAKSGVASSAFTITHGVTYDVSISLVIADGTAAGALSPAFSIQLNLVP